jgi:hypothetical protein
MAIDDSFLSLFGAPDDVLCPMLTHFVVGRASAAFSDGAALALIKARMAMERPLQFIDIDFNHGMEFDILPELQAFVSDGLRIGLHYSMWHWKFKPDQGLQTAGPFDP